MPQINEYSWLSQTFTFILLLMCLNTIMMYAAVTFTSTSNKMKKSKIQIKMFF